MNGELLSTLRSKTFSDVLISAVIKEKHNIVFSLVKISDGN